MRASLRALLLLASATSPWALASPALAVPPRGAGTGGATGSPATGAWQPLFEEGRRHHEAGRYEDAAEAFYRAHEAGGPASLLYNQALCLDRLERFEGALAAYRAYLDASPSAANRAEVEARMRELEVVIRPPEPGRLAARIAPSSGAVMQLMPLDAGFQTIVVGEGRAIAPVADPGPRVEEAGPEWVASWFLLVGTLGSAGAAIAVGLDGQATFDALRADCAAIGGCTEAEIAGSSAHTSATVTNVLLVATGVLGAATVLSFVIEGAMTSGPRVYAGIGPGSLTLRGTF
jgi:hypothetical protein